MAIATGQITIIDYNDAVTLTGFIGSNHPKTQQYNPDNGAYSPDWTSVNLVLTPSLFKLGSGSDIITDAAVQTVQWYSVSAGTETLITADSNHVYSGTKNQILTIKLNEVAGLPAKDYVCKVTYLDPTTAMSLIHKMTITFSRVVNGGGIADAVAWCPDGNVFKNGGVATVSAKCDLWRGSIIDNTSVTYQWYMQDPSVVVDEGAGVGWNKLDATTNFGCTGYTTNTLVIPDAAVTNYAVFKCQIKDTDSNSNTYNQYFYDTVSVVDQSDTIQVSIQSSGGDVFKNGVGSSTLTAKVFQALTDITGNYAAANFRWYKYDKNGTLVTGWGGATDYKTGLTISVGDSDVDVKATFRVDLV